MAMTNEELERVEELLQLMELDRFNYTLRQREKKKFKYYKNNKDKYYSEGKCVICKSLYIKHFKNQRYCSENCIDRLYVNLKLYKRLTRTNWYRTRKMILDKFDNKCVKCKKAKDLSVHHIKPISLGGTNNPDNLTVLCNKCHVLQHRKIARNIRGFK